MIITQTQSFLNLEEAQRGSLFKEIFTGRLNTGEGRQAANVNTAQT